MRSGAHANTTAPSMMPTHINHGRLAEELSKERIRVEIGEAGEVAMRREQGHDRVSHER